MLEIDPDNAWAHYQLGAILEHQGRDAKAVEQYGRAFRLDPSLAFPDVNPSVIASHLTTEAMLRGYRTGLEQTPAPRVYQEPKRIARALVSAEPMLAPEDMPDGDAMAVETPQPDAGEDGAAAAPNGGPRRVLDSQDLSDRPANQATPPGRAGYRPPVQPGSGAAGRMPSPVRTSRPQQDTRRGAAATPCRAARWSVATCRAGPPCRRCASAARRIRGGASTCRGRRSPSAAPAGWRWCSTTAAAPADPGPAARPLAAGLTR